MVNKNKALPFVNLNREIMLGRLFLCHQKAMTGDIEVLYTSLLKERYCQFGEQPATNRR
jgi:hypothetical protein